MPSSETQTGRPRLLFYGAFFLFSVFVALYLIPDGDFWVHLAQGIYILDRHEIPTADVFSFTYGGQPWNNWEWFHNVFSALLWNGAGPLGIIAFRIILTFVLSVIIFRIYRSLSNNDILSFGLSLLVLLLVQQRISDRPQLFAYVALALVLHLAITISSVFSWRFLMFFVTMIIFRNSHPSWIVAMPLLISIFIDDGIRKERSFRKIEWGILLGSFLLLFLLAPFQVDILHYVTLQFSPHLLNEWRDIVSLGPMLFSTYYLLFFSFSILLIISISLSIKHFPVYALTSFFLLCNAYLHVRFVADIAIIGSLLIARTFARFVPLHQGPRGTLAYLSILCCALWLGSATFDQLGFHRGIGIDQNKVPLYVGDYIKSKELRGNYFGLYSGSTDFLMAYAYPQIKVAVDIRVPGLYSYDFAQRYWSIHNEDEFRRYVLPLPSDYIILGRPDHLAHQLHDRYVERILRAEDWRLLYFDRRYALYARDAESGGRKLEVPFTHLSRWNIDPQEIQRAVSAGKFDELMSELRELRENTGGRDNYYRALLETLYVLPFFDKEQRDKLEDLYDVPAEDLKDVSALTR